MDPPTLSLGRFQDAAAAPPLPAGAEIARRSTGGGAIYHHARSRVFALTVDTRVHPSARDPLRWYARTNRVLIAAFAALGASAQVRDRQGSLPGDDTFLCFDRRERTDVVALRDGTWAKLAGSAQRRTADGVLLHGAVSLAPGELAQGAISLTEAAGRPIDEAEWVAALLAAFAADGWSLEPPA